MDAPGHASAGSDAEIDRPVTRAAFVVRVSREADGAVSGIVERPRSGEKARFTGFEGLGAALARMLEREEATRGEGADEPSPGTKRQSRGPHHHDETGGGQHA
jgi:hypothetical protein